MVSDRPVTASCAHCGRSFRLNIKGRPAKFCKASCRVMAFEKAHRGTRPPKVPFADQVALRVWQMLADAKLVTGELPPKRTSGVVS